MSVPTVAVDDRRGAEVDRDAPQGDDDEPDPRSLGDLLAAVLAAEGVAEGAEAGLHLVGVEEIARLNAEHLGVEGPTDVLSFPLDGREPAAGPGPVVVGDVVLCADVAVAQAAGHAGTPADELRLLVVHGGLHLCGWDHDGDDERRDMWARERELMAELGVPPSGDPWGSG